MNKDAMKSYKVGARIAVHVQKLVRNGFSDTYNSDDPVVRWSSVGYKLRHWDLHRLTAFGIGIAEWRGPIQLVEFYGRRTALLPFAELIMDGRTVYGVDACRGYDTEMSGLSEGMNHRLTAALQRYHDPDRVKHLIAEHHPEFRNHNHNTAAEIVLHKRVGMFVGIGPLFSDNLLV